MDMNVAVMTVIVAFVILLFELASAFINRRDVSYFDCLAHSHSTICRAACTCIIAYSGVCMLPILAQYWHNIK